MSRLNNGRPPNHMHVLIKFQYLNKVFTDVYILACENSPSNSYNVPFKNTNRRPLVLGGNRTEEGGSLLYLRIVLGRFAGKVGKATVVVGHVTGQRRFAGTDAKRRRRRWRWRSVIHGAGAVNGFCCVRRRDETTYNGRITVAQCTRCYRVYYRYDYCRRRRYY